MCKIFLHFLLSAYCVSCCISCCCLFWHAVGFMWCVNKMYYMKFIATTLFSIFTLAVSARDAGWTLEECMRYAVEHNPQTTIQQAQNNIYKQNYIEAVAALMPSVSANSNVNFNFGRGLDAETNTYTNINSFSNNYGISSSMTLFDGLSSVYRVRMNKINRIMGKHQLQARRDDVAYATMEAFFDVQYNKELVALAEKQLQQSNDNLHQTRRKAELGILGFPDVAEMQAQQAADNYNLTRQKNVLAISVIVLKEKMNFPIDEDIEIENYTSGDMIVKTPKTALDIYENALSYLPQALAAEYTLKAQQMSHKAAIGGLSPSFSVGAGINTGFARQMNGDPFESFKDQFRNKRGSYVGFSMSVPIFNGLSRSSNVRRSKYQLLIARSQKEQTLRALYSEIEKTVSDMNGQADEYVQAVKQRESAAVAYDVNKRKYDEGLVSALDLHTTANRLLQAQIEEKNAQLKYYIKRRMVEYYDGEPFFQDTEETEQ